MAAPVRAGLLGVLPFLLVGAAMSSSISAQQFADLLGPFSNVPFPLDMDGDGDVDVVAGAQVVLNDGTGGFSSPVPLTNFPTSSVVTAFDLDGSSGMDLLVHGEPLQVLRNAGGVDFTDVTTTFFPQPFPEGERVALLDANQDGHLDFLAVGAASQQPDLTFRTAYSIILNDGAGGVAGTVQGELDGNVVGTILTGDYNADGRHDIAAQVELPTGLAPAVFLETLGSYGSVVILPSTGAPVRTAPITVPESGQLVLATPVLFGVRFDVYGPISAPNATFESSLCNASLIGGQLSSVAVHVRDFNGDATPDLFWSSRLPPQAAFSRGPTFGSSCEVPQLSGVQALNAVADLDGDGDLDLLGFTRILLNLRQQLTVPQFAAIGQVLEITAFSRPNSGAQPTAFAAVFFGVPRLTPIPTPFGNLWIDIVVELPPITTGPDGSGTTSLSVPNAPALIGLQPAFQALLVEPGTGFIGFTNRDSTTIF